jgi:hypothetical protein
MSPEVLGFLLLDWQMEDTEVVTFCGVEGAMPTFVLVAALLFRLSRHD